MPSLADLFDTTKPILRTPQRTPRSTPRQAPELQVTHPPITNLYSTASPVANVWIQEQWKCEGCGHSGHGTPELGTQWEVPGGIRLWKASLHPVSGLPTLTEATEVRIGVCPQCVCVPELEPNGVTQ